jgi:hypothetical protein
MNEIATNSMLDGLARQIKDDLGRRENVREQWVAATLDLCRHLAEAREQFKADKAFSAWLTASGLGEDALSKDDRASAIAMGEDLKTAEKVLASTERRSLQMIYRKEFRVRSATKPDKPPKPKAPPRIAPEVEAIIVKAVFEEGKTKPEAEAIAGVSSTVVRRVVAAEEGRRSAVTIDPTVDLKSYLSLAAQQKLEALERRLRKSFEAEVKEEARIIAIKNMDEIFLPHHKEKIAMAERVLASRKGILTKANFNLIRSCLHPDNSASPERRAKAFDLFNSLEILVLDETQMPIGKAPPLPSSAAEWQALKDKVSAERRAKRTAP